MLLITKKSEIICIPNKNIETESTIGLSLKVKVSLSLFVYLIIRENETVHLVPYFICKKPYIAYNRKLNYFLAD